MLIVERKSEFLKKTSKIKDNAFKEHIKKLIQKIIDIPEIGKPM